MSKDKSPRRSPVARAKAILMAAGDANVDTVGFLELTQSLRTIGTPSDLSYAALKLAQLLEVEDGVVADRALQLRRLGIRPVRALTCWDILVLIGTPEDRDWLLRELWGRPSSPTRASSGLR